MEFGTGHLGIFGSGRTGRTSALRALAAGIARANAPTAVHIHGVDGGRGLAGLVALPHAGVVADDDDPERLERLLTRLADEVRAGAASCSPRRARRASPSWATALLRRSCCSSTVGSA